MDSIVEFLKTRSDIKIASLEKELGLPNASIKLTKDYIAPKHEEAIRDYLIKHYGYSEEIVEEMKSEDNINSPTRIIKQYNEGYKPGFKDGIMRYRDSIGLWRKLNSAAAFENGGTILKKELQPQNDEVMDDEVGSFYIANCGWKIYVTYKG